MFMKKPQERKTRRSCGAVVSMDGKRSYTVKDDTTGTVRFTRLATTCAEQREEDTSVPVQMPNANVTDNPPKPQPKIPRKQKAGNPSESVETSRPRRAIEPPVKYGYE